MILKMMLLEERETEVEKIREATKRIETDITELESLLYAAAYGTTERMSMLKKRK